MQHSADMVHDAAWQVLPLCMCMYVSVYVHIYIHRSLSLCLHIYVYIIFIYLMAAANAADPKTERKTEAERPAVSLGRVGPSRAE